MVEELVAGLAVEPGYQVQLRLAASLVEQELLEAGVEDTVGPRRAAVPGGWCLIEELEPFPEDGRHPGPLPDAGQVCDLLDGERLLGVRQHADHGLLPGEPGLVIGP